MFKTKEELKLSVQCGEAGTETLPAAPGEQGHVCEQGSSPHRSLHVNTQELLIQSPGSRSLRHELPTALKQPHCLWVETVPAPLQDSQTCAGGQAESQRGCSEVQKTNLSSGLFSIASVFRRRFLHSDMWVKLTSYFFSKVNASLLKYSSVVQILFSFQFQ